MTAKVLKQLVSDIHWTFSQDPFTLTSGLFAVARLLYWHLILKRTSRYHIGSFQSVPFIYDHASDGCAQAYITPYYEYSVQEFLKKKLQKGAIFIDVGANSGTESLVAAKTGCTVYAFEPTVSVFNLLAATVLLNTVRFKMYVYCIAVAEKDGFVSFFTQRQGKALLNSTKKPKNSETVEHKVASRALDSFIQEKQIPYVDVLKIDVEGAELSVLKGAQKSLRTGKIKAIIWESNMQATPEERQKTRNYLSNFGYTHHYFDPKIKKIIEWNFQDDCISILHT